VKDSGAISRTGWLELDQAHIRHRQAEQFWRGTDQPCLADTRQIVELVVHAHAIQRDTQLSPVA